MIVKVRFILDYYKFFGKHELILNLPENITLHELIDFIDNNIKNGFKERIIDNNSIRYPNMILINGRRAEFFNGLNTIIKDNDTITFSPLAYFAL